jgi:hypothetical protein
MKATAGAFCGGIIEDLQAALEELKSISNDLAQTPGAQEGERSDDKTTE